MGLGPRIIMTEEGRLGFLRKLHKYRIKYATKPVIGVSEPRKILRNKEEDPVKYAERLVMGAEPESPGRTLMCMNGQELVDFIDDLSPAEMASLIFYLVRFIKTFCR